MPASQRLAGVIECLSRCKASYTARQSAVTWSPCCNRYHSLFMLGMLVMFECTAIHSSLEWSDFGSLLAQVLLPVHAGHAGDV